MPHSNSEIGVIFSIDIFQSMVHIEHEYHTQPVFYIGLHGLTGK